MHKQNVCWPWSNLSDKYLHILLKGQYILRSFLSKNQVSFKILFYPKCMLFNSGYILSMVKMYLQTFTKFRMKIAVVVAFFCLSYFSGKSFYIELQSNKAVPLLWPLSNKKWGLTADHLMWYEIFGEKSIVFNLKISLV